MDAWTAEAGAITSCIAPKALSKSDIRSIPAEHITQGNKHLGPSRPSEAQFQTASGSDSPDRFKHWAIRCGCYSDPDEEEEVPEAEINKDALVRRLITECIEVSTDGNEGVAVRYDLHPGAFKPPKPEPGARTHLAHTLFRQLKAGTRRPSRIQRATIPVRGPEPEEGG